MRREGDPIKKMEEAGFWAHDHHASDLQPVINFDQFNECCHGDVELEQQIIEIFFVTGMESIRVLENAIRLGDADTTASEAHKLKGSCLALGADSLARVCETIQAAARSGNLDCLSPFVELARVNFASLHKTLIERTDEIVSCGFKRAA